MHGQVLTPLDCVKQRLQLGLYGGFVDCVRTMVREEGGVKYVCDCRCACVCSRIEFLFALCPPPLSNCPGR